MWRCIVMAALVACGSKPNSAEEKKPTKPDTSEPPDPDEYKAMSPEHRCEATASRGARCYSLYMQAQIDELSLAGEEIDLALKPNKREDREAYLISCGADPSLADATVACWSRSKCRDHVTCVLAAQARGPIDPPDPDRFRAMSPDDRCAATRKRANRCRSELERLLAPTTTAIPVDGPPPDPDDEEAAARGRRRIKLDEARLETGYTHHEACSRPSYTDALAACWKTEPCDAFARCVKDRTH